MEKLAHLAMLNLSDAERLKNDIEVVLNTFKILEEADDAEYVPQKGQLREDEAKNSFRRSDLLRNTVSEDGFIVVPRVVEK